MITDVDDFFRIGCGRCDRFATAECSARRWAAGLAELRRICLAADLAETAKWGHPCYMHGDRNIVIFGAFRDDFRLSFFNAALMSDPLGLLQKQGPNTRHKDMIRFQSQEQVMDMEPHIRSYILEAIGYAKAGTKPEKEEIEIELPQSLVDALDADPELAEAFHSLTPGRQRSYVINLNAAKTLGTQLTRIAAFRPKILAGKGAQER